MEPQDGDIADGPNGQHLVFKAGSWHPANAEGRPLAPIPRPDYGPGMYELPSGDVAHRGPRGGFEIVQRADAAAGNGATGSVGTPESRGRLTLAVGPAVTAEDSLGRQEVRGGQRINPYNRDWGASLIDAIPDNNALSALARVVGGQDYQNYNQSVKTIEAALLPVFAGMAVTESEAQRFIRANQPQMGDSPETLQRKARNRQMVLNEAAGMLGREIPFPEVGRYGEAGFRAAVELGDVSRVDPAIIAQPGSGAGPDTDANGIPNYPSIERMTAGLTGGMDTPVDPGPDKPGSSEANPISIVDVSPDELLKALSNGGYVRYPDGRVEKVAGATRGQAVEGATPVAPGVTRNPDVPAMERTDPFSVAVRNIAAFGQGAAEQVPFVDEAAAYAASRLTGIDYDTAREVQALASDADRRERPLARNAGGLAGFGATFLAPGGVALKAGQPILNTARLAGAGAATGAVYGAGQGEGDISERGQNALEGAAIGAVAGPTVNALARPVVNAARPLAQFGGRQIGGLAERIGIPGAGRLVQASTPNALASSVDRLPRMDANALAARADELDALGIQPAFIDVVDDARQGTFRALNTRDTPARETATRLAETRRRNLPSRVRNIAEQEVSAESRPTLEVIDELSKTRRTNAETGMADFGQNAVRLNENAVQAVRSDLVKSALRDAAVRAQASLDPVERAAANRLNQLADTALDNPAQAQLTVREAQDISAALNAAADGAFRSNTPANGPVLQTLGRAIRQSARESSEGYDNWLRQYADDSQLMEAATTGRNFVQADVNPIGARSTDAFVRQAQQATPPELMVQRAAARQAMEAQGAGPTGARSVLESLASNEDQYRRAAALGLDADALRARGDAELRMVQNAQNVSPRVGSQTATNMADQVGEAAGLAGAAMRGDLPGVVGRLGRRIMSRGFSDKQAEAISMAAMDPTRTREIIDLLATKMSRQDARSLLRSIRFAASRGAGEYAGEE